MATSKASGFTSPFIYTTFAPSDSTSVYAVYKKRIIDIYQQKYPSIKELSINDINAIITNAKVTQFKKQQQEKSVEAKKAEDDNKKNDEKKDDKKEEKKDDKKDDKKDEKKDDKKDEKKDDKPADIEPDKSDIIEIPKEITVEQHKLLKALDLLENEYFGNEHALYIYLCNKYKMDLSILDEYDGKSGNTITHKRLEQSDHIICRECEEKKDFTQFDPIELANGYFAACKECAPHRDNVKTVKWNPEWISPSISLKEKDYVCYKDRNGHEGATTDLKPPLNTGQHCFRWLLKNHQGWVLIGIGYPQKNQNNLYCARGVYGIANGNGCYKNGVSEGGLNCHHLYNNVPEKYIDMKVDINKGEIWYVEVDDAQERVTKITGIPKGDKGYVPVVSMYYARHNIQIKKIPVAWFGKNVKRTKFKY